MDGVISWLDGANVPSTPEAAIALNSLAASAMSEEGQALLTTIVDCIEEVARDHA